MNCFGQFCILFVVVVIVGANSLMAQEPDYFPMHIGDKWIYRLYTGGAFHGRHYANQVIEVTDTILVARKKYFVFDDKIYDILYEPGKVYHRTHYFRRKKNGDIVRFSDRINGEQLYYTFQRDSLRRPYFYFDESLPIHQKWKITFVGTGATVALPVGTYDNCARFLFDIWSNERVIPLEVRDLAPGVGLLFVAGEGDTDCLVGAYINGSFIGDTTLTSVEQIEETQVPLLPILHQNYPNPFNDATWLSYSVPDHWIEPVKVSIFDLLGREILSFTYTNVSDRNREWEWNGTDKFGRDVNSGIYLIRLHSGQFSQVIKIDLRK